MIGTTISHYTITEKLGEGGMGVVYKAHDTLLERDVAVKFLSSTLADSPDDKERFVREAKAASSLNHPSICTIHDFGEHDGHLFFVMELVQGKTFKELAGTLDEQTCLRLIREVAEGLGVAHAKQIVHRDVKSGNLMLAADGRVKIMDFGLAQVSGRSELTTVGTTIGTLAYLPPEQARGEDVDRRADIYALGVVLFELLTGERPFNADYHHAMLYQILNEESPAPSQRKKGLNASTDAIVHTCLAKELAQRYQSTTELQDAITTALSGSKVKALRSRPKPRFLIPLGSLLIVALLITVVGPVRIWDRFISILGFTAIPDEQHLAVLPFTNIGNDVDRQALCDGLTETMTSQLTQLEQFLGSMWVVPSTDVRRAGITSAEGARKSFGVNLVVDGSLQMIGNDYRVTLNLVNATSIRQINSTSIDIQRKNLATLQDASVMKVLEMLHLRLHPESQNVLQSGGTSVPAAYEYYLRGISALSRYEKEENIDGAILDFQLAIKEDTGYALAHAGLGEAFWRKYEVGQDTRWVRPAIEECEHARTLDDKLAPVNVTLGIVYTGTGKPDSAIHFFEAALRIDPANADAYRGLANAYEAKGDLVTAEQTYKRAIELRPDYWASYNALGVFYTKYSRYNDAIPVFKKVIQLTPNNYKGYRNLGGMYYYLDQRDKAREMFEKSYAIFPDYTIASNLGTLSYIEGRYEEAAQWYERALTHNANDYGTVGNLASAYYWTSDQRSKAPALYHRAIVLALQQLDVNPRDAETRGEVGGYYAMLGQKDSALFYTEHALKTDTTDARLLFVAATTYEKFGDRNQALYWIGKALDAGYSVGEISNQPELHNLYADARYRALVGRKR
jgi:serine/threonine protein kinase/tetratricopeptide (TPR) repeat protein